MTTVTDANVRQPRHTAASSIDNNHRFIILQWKEHLMTARFVDIFYLKQVSC
jgi:hypothetical protein